MAWEQRGNKSYFYRTRRIGGRVVKIYMGGGRVGEQAAERDAAQRATRAMQRRTMHQVQQQYEAVDDQLTTADAEADAITEAMLLAAGYYRHSRGPWRRRRYGGKAKDRQAQA